MNFSEVLRHLQNGSLGSRKAWDDNKNHVARVVFLQIDAHIPGEAVPKMQSVPNSVKNMVADKGAHLLHYTNQMAIIDITNKTCFTIEGYSPSVQDTLAGDWYSIY